VARRALFGGRGAWAILSFARIGFLAVTGFAVVASPSIRAAGAADGSFELHSALITPGSTISNDQVYNSFGCSGKNISPPLAWSGAPSATRSFALTMFDPDAPGAGWWHWVVYDIPASTPELPQSAGDPGGKLPAGAVQGRTDFGISAYGGPCPPVGNKPHRYIFTIYALKVAKLDVPAGAHGAQVGSVINANKLASASFTALYGR
jgi:Raf kinase inhibitor-like YbhB/YbcL family protein